MKKSLFTLAAFVLAGFATSAQEVEFEEFDLDNGLHVILHQDNTAPVVITSVMYNVGGKDVGGTPDAPRTGFAHFFEHLLFEGSENIERGEFMKIIPANGGTFNANTSQDRTYYYEIFPSNKLELGLWLESERMLHPVIDQVGVDTQNEVVKEEKRQRYDAPYGGILEAIGSNLFKVHPYKDPNIGYMEDLDASTLEEFNQYFKDYYGPNNAVLVVAGDIDINKTKKMVSDYFSEVKRGPEVVRNFPKETPITETIKAQAFDKNIQVPAIIATYRTPGFGTRDAYVLDMISSYLSGGKSSVLYKKLVDEQKQALAVQAVNLGQMDYSVFALFAIPLGEVDLTTLLTEMDEEIAVMQTELISERDYQKLINQFENQFVNSNSSIAGIASSLATYYLLYGDVNLINKEIDIYRSITREEIRDVAKKYLSPNQRVELEYLPQKDEN
ncbi:MULTISPECIES: M16 family metallopeptidase [Flavobacteriaceae]|jgi:predicted Zn-dependent peptidase|uniref:Zn-dependent peptidase n=2 Tax=Flavobacteriaceae TaxID=49546 RepID=A0ABP3UNB8_9FLAO|nr:MULTISPECIES: pitrilysin family protein [Flavobacteriaceae]TBV28402.1 insulinase family protein [Meridianimaribacter sp. CL38]TDY13457.1 putative Zn-dependent peptidase [Meridianimaribacter flavus]